jgi:hypothetical protein
LLESIDDKQPPRPKKGAINNSRQRLPSLFYFNQTAFSKPRRKNGTT